MPGLECLFPVGKTIGQEFRQVLTSETRASLGGNLKIIHPVAHPIVLAKLTHIDECDFLVSTFKHICIWARISWHLSVWVRGERVHIIPYLEDYSIRTFLHLPIIRLLLCQRICMQQDLPHGQLQYSIWLDFCLLCFPCCNMRKTHGSPVKTCMFPCFFPLFCSAFISLERLNWRKKQIVMLFESLLFLRWCHFLGRDSSHFLSSFSILSLSK